MSETAIHILNFTKTYPVPKQKLPRVAVDNLTMDVPAGSLFGFLGPNGAGKTTTIKMLLGFVAATRGGGRIFGVDCSDDGARKRVGYLPEQPYFPKFLSAIEVVQAHAGLAGLCGSRSRSRCEESLKQVGMWESRHMPLSKCSKGMTQRVALATALVHEPELLIMDEPSSGLDPVGRKELRTLLTDLRVTGKTIFLSSHLLSEMESVCDQVGILSQGRLVAYGKPSDIVRTRDEIAVQIPADERLAVPQEDLELWGGRVEQVEGNAARIVVPSERVYGLMRLLEKNSVRLLGMIPQRESLEDAFLRLVG